MDDLGTAIAPSFRATAEKGPDAPKPAGGIYLSDDAGETWRLVNSERRLWGRGWYFGQIAVDPANPDRAYDVNTATYMTLDAGKTWVPVKGAPGGDDYHQLWINPKDGNRMVLSSDQGTVVCVDGAKTWSTWYNQPTAQIYHVAADNRFPYWLYGAQQDSGSGRRTHVVAPGEVDIPRLGTYVPGRRKQHRRAGSKRRKASLWQRRSALRPGTEYVRPGWRQASSPGPR